MESSSYLDFIQNEVYPTLSKFSTAMACIVVLIMICLSIYDYSLVDRVSLRLQTVISCYDIWLHTAQIWKRQYETGPSLMCTFIGWQYVFFPLLYAFLNISITVNLQLIFLHDIYITKKIEILYWVIPILLGLIISIPPLALGKLGYSEFNGCYTTEKDETYGKLFDFYSYEIPMILCMGYLIVITILVLKSLNQGIKSLNKGRLNMNNSNSKKIISLKLLATRVLLYPLIMIITHLGFVVANIYYDLNPTSLDNLDNLDNLDIWNMTCRGLTGTLNLIAFLCDPTIQSALRKVYDRVIKKRLFDSEDVDRFDFPSSIINPTTTSIASQESGTLGNSNSEEEQVNDIMRTL